MNQSKQFITSPIYYVNGSPHLGHLYTSVATDILHRFHLLCGGESFFSIGTDEHGQKVEQSANLESSSMQDYVDKMYLPFKMLLEEADTAHDAFIRTTSQTHKETVMKFWDKLKQSGDIYEGNYSGWYSTRDEQFYSEDEIENGKAKVSGSPVEWMEEKCMFFKLSKYKEKLLDYYKANKTAIAPIGRYNEVIGMLQADLPDLAVTRSRFSWGINAGNGQVIYVWVDALTNYITAMGDQVDYWINDMIHIIGKDILKFHAIYWPAFLMCAGYSMPKRIYAHGWWTVDGQKMSKSIGNVVDPFEILKKYGVDQIRYCIMREMSFGQDGDFSFERLEKRINSELVNVMGNLAQRILKFTHKEFGKIISVDELSDIDMNILKNWDDALEESVNAIQNQQIHIYLENLYNAASKTNQYIDAVAPWKCEKEDKARILGVAIECIKRMAILMQPIMPNKSQEIATILGVDEIIGNWDVPVKEINMEVPGGLFERV